MFLNRSGLRLGFYGKNCAGKIYAGRWWIRGHSCNGKNFQLAMVMEECWIRRRFPVHPSFIRNMRMGGHPITCDTVTAKKLKRRSFFKKYSE